ncbi:MAG: hypothetical protein LBO67_02285 [Spirochaetaceae bacterium]|jgi:flagellar biosynthesis/type III secretory pathway chaperone|nr:hypothetical protein [Spirochaetaceae bacterium]
MAINFKELASKTGEKAQNLSEKGLAASKDFMTKMGEKAQDLSEIGEKGWAASKDFMTKVSEKAQNLSEKGLTAIEIKQLQAQEKKLIAQLGQTVHRLLIEEKIESINADTPEVKATLLEIIAIQEEIAKKNSILTSQEPQV